MHISLQTRKRCVSGAALVALLAVSGAVAQPAAPHVLVLEGGTLIDGTGKPPISDAVIVVEGNHIKAVGKKGQVAIPAGATIIKTDGRTILPGLLDIHLHTVDWQIPMFLHYGVTTVADQNNDATWILAEREALKAGKIEGPRMFVGGSSIEGTQIYPLRPILDNGFNYKPVQNAAEARAYAEAMVAAGVDFIKLHNTISDDELRATVQVGKETGHPVMGHTQNIRRAVEIGTKFAEHMWTVAFALLDPEDKTKIGQGSSDNPQPESLIDPKTFPPLIAYLVKQGVYMNPPLISLWGNDFPRAQKLSEEAARVAKDPGLAFVPAEVKKGWIDIANRPKHEGFAKAMEFLREYGKAGGKIVIGTGTGYEPNQVPGLSEQNEMQLFVDLGYTPMQVIQAATLWNAQCIQQDKDVGSVEPGKYADFLVIDGDPLKDIAATKNVRMVIKDGQVVDTKYDPHWVNPIPAPMLAWEGIGRAPGIDISPNGVPLDGKTVTLELTNEKKGTIYGSNALMDFNSHTVVRFDNIDLPTHFISAGKLTATLDAKDFPKTPGSYPVYVVNPGIHGWVSKASYLDIGGGKQHVISGYAVVNGRVLDKPTFSNGSSAITPFYGPTPRSARQGSGAVTLSIEGTGFTPASVVRVDDAALPTHFVSATKLTATLGANFLQRAPGGYVVYVVNPGPLGGITKPGFFLVDLKK